MQNQIYTYSWDGNQPQHFQIGKTVNSKQQNLPEKHKNCSLETHKIFAINISST